MLTVNDCKFLFDLVNIKLNHVNGDINQELVSMSPFC